MKYSATEEIDAPIDAVFERFCDFDRFETAAIKRGAKVNRIATNTKELHGLRWNTAFDLRGKRREVMLELVQFERPNHMKLAHASQGMDGGTLIEFSALPLNRTRVRVQFELKPKSLSGRLLIQSLRLAKKSLNQKFKDNFAKFAGQIERENKVERGSETGQP